MTRETVMSQKSAEKAFAAQLIAQWRGRPDQIGPFVGHLSVGYLALEELVIKAIREAQS